MTFTHESQSLLIAELICIYAPEGPLKAKSAENNKVTTKW